MKALILAAGYGTRLAPLTTHRAKPLLHVGGRPIIDALVEQFDRVGDVDEILVVTNERFARDFERWVEALAARRAGGAAPLTVVNDGTMSNETRLGGVGDLHFAVTARGIDGELLVAAGDQIYTFDFRELVRFFRTHGSAVALHRLDDPAAIARYSEVRLDAGGRIVEFREKPAAPRYALCAACLYVLRPEDVRRVGEYLATGGTPDAPGYYIEWLHTRTDVYGYEFGGVWYDIGDLEVYREADRFFTERAAKHVRHGAPTRKDD